jgi:hypothetical protein
MIEEEGVDSAQVARYKKWLSIYELATGGQAYCAPRLLILQHLPGLALRNQKTTIALLSFK